MDNEKLLNMGIELLQGVNVQEAEIIDVETSKYDDGSTSLVVRVSFPAEDAIEETEVIV